MKRDKSSVRAGAYERRETMYGLLFGAPAILGFLIFVLGPMIASLVLSFTDYSVVNVPSFIGIKNYVDIFDGTDPFFYTSLSATSYYVLLSVPAGIIFAFLLAFLLNCNVLGKSIFRTIFYIPSIVPIVASSMIWMWILNPDLGLANAILKTFGLPTSMWVYSEEAVIPSLAIMSLWATGNSVIIFLAGLQGIPSHMYEAVEVDGGNAMHKLRHITVPMMTPTIFFNLIMGCIGAFQTFVQAYTITQGGPNNKSLFYVYYLYRETFTRSRMGYGSAVAWILFVIICILTIIIFKSSNTWVYYEGGDNK